MISKSEPINYTLEMLKEITEANEVLVEQIGLQAKLLVMNNQFSMLTNRFNKLTDELLQMQQYLKENNY